MTPDYKIEVDGKTLGDAEKSLISSIDITDEVGTKADSFTMVFSDKDRIIKRPRRGVSVKFFAGYIGQDLKIMGRYIVDGFAVRRGQVIVKCKGFDGKTSIKNSFDGIYQDKSLAEVIKDVAARNKLSAKVSPAFDKEKRMIIQQGESDLSFLNRLAKENDATFKVQGREILFVPRGKGESSSGEKLPSVSIDIESISPNWSYDDDPRDDFGEVSAAFFDLNTGEEGEVKKGSGEPKKKLQKTFHSKAEANAAANSEFSKSRESAERLTLSMRGHADLKSERRTTIRGLDPEVDGSWIITKAHHKIGKGWEASLELSKVIRDDGANP